MLFPCPRLEFGGENDFVLLVRVVVDQRLRGESTRQIRRGTCGASVHFRIVEMDKVFGSYSPNTYPCSSIQALWGRMKTAAANFVVRIVIIPNAVDRHFLLNILQGEKHRQARFQRRLRYTGILQSVVSFELSIQIN